jgi:hypothetical protein
MCCFLYAVFCFLRKLYVKTFGTRLGQEGSGEGYPPQRIGYFCIWDVLHMTDDSDQQLARLQAEIAALKQALATLAALPDAQRPLLEQLADKERQLAALTVARSSAGLSVTAPLSAARDVNIATSQTIINQGASDGPDRATLLREYLLTLSGTCNRLSLADADSSDPTRAAVELAAVYTRLEVATTVPLPEDKEQIHITYRQRTALEVFSEQSRLVLLGEPGSGKSTFINFLGLCLARTCLGETGWLERLGKDWSHDALIPIHIVLRDFAAWLEVRGKRPIQGNVTLLWEWMAHRQGKQLVSIFRQEVAAGRAVLLLDGLDEVPSGAQGQTIVLVRQVIDALAATAGQRRMLVTCRVRDYYQPQWQLHGWPTETLQPFSMELCDEFISRWYEALARLERPMNGDSKELCSLLQGQLRARLDLSKMASNPLLLTMMLLLHAYEGRLPEERVKLYGKCVEFLLYRWRAHYGEKPLRDLLGLPLWSESDLNRLLDRLGFAAHELGNDGTDGVSADLPRTVLLEVARAFFAPYGEDLHPLSVIKGQAHPERHMGTALQR